MPNPERQRTVFALSTEPLQVGQFAIVDHEPVDRGPNAGIFHGRGPADDRAELYIVAEGTTPAGEAFAGHVVSAVGHAWQTLDMSLTGALRQLFREAARNLRDWNQKSIAQHRVSIGLTCFARRGSQAVIAQAGPSVAFHYGGGKTTAYFADEEHGQPIGMGRPVDPQLTRIDFGPGDRLLLISTASLRVIDDELFGGVLGLPADRILPELFHRLAEVRDLTVVLVTDPARDARAEALAHDAAGDDEFVIGGEADLPSASPAAAAHEGERPSFQASLFINDDSAVEAARQRLLAVSAEARVRVMTPQRLMVEDEAPLPLRRVAGETVLAQLAAARESRLLDARAQMQAAAGPMPAQALAGAARSVPTGERRPRRDSSFSRGLRRGDEVPPIRPSAEGPGADAPFAEDLAREFRARINPASFDAEEIAGEAMALRNGGSVVRLRGSMGGRWKGNGAVNRRTINAAGQPPAWLVLVIGVGLLVALVAVLTVPGLVREKEGEQYAQLVDNAQQLLSTASVADDRAEKRTALAQAHELLVRASASDDAGPEVTGLLDQAKAGIAGLDAIVEPAAVEPIADLREFGDLPVTVAKIEAGTENAYLFDSNAGQVIAVALATGEKQAVYQQDEAAGRERPMTIALTSSADLGGETVIVAADSRLWGYSASAGLRELGFARPDGLTITDMTVYNGALYVLDANEHAIFRFEATSDGFSAAPFVVEDNAALAAGRRLLVAGDEYITSDADGTVHWFSGGAAVVLGQAGIDERLVAPEPPQAMGTGGEYGFVDSRSSRIVVLQRDGSFVRQYRHKDFESLMAVAIGEAGSYVFSGGQLRRVTW